MPRGGESRETGRGPGIGKRLALMDRWPLLPDPPPLKLESDLWEACLQGRNPVGFEAKERDVDTALGTQRAIWKSGRTRGGWRSEA